MSRADEFKRSSLSVMEVDMLRARAATALRLARESADKARDEALEEAAVVADSFTCGICGMDGKAATAIRALRRSAT